MRKIWAIARKDTILRFSGWAEWLFFLILPVVFTVVLAGGTGPPRDPRIHLDVVDQAASPLSAELFAALGQSASVRPELQPLAKAENDFKLRRVSALLVIPTEFDVAGLAQGSVPLELRQQPNDLNALAASQAVAAVTARMGSAVDIARAAVRAAEAIRPFASDAARQDFFATSLDAARTQLSQAPSRVTTVAAATKAQIEYDPRANSSAGQLITWTFIPLLAISSMFAYERQKGTLRRLLVTPTRKSTYLLATLLGQVAMALVQMLLLVVFGAAVMRLSWGQSPLALAVMLVASALAAAALGTSLGTLVRTEGQASGLSIMAGMVMALLGGCWYPLELFQQFVRTAVKVLPTTWAMQGLLAIVLRGQGISAVLMPAAVLLGFAAVFFVLGVWRFRYE